MRARIAGITFFTFLFTTPVSSLHAGMIFIPLGDLPGGDGFSQFYSVAYGVSADGATVVGVSKSGNGQEAYRWTPGTGMVGLGFLPGGTSSSSATGVSADGSVIVGHSLSSSGTQAFRWTSGTGMVGLGDLPGGTFSSKASGVSADGSVVVGSSESGNGPEAFRWTSGTGMVGLGDLPGGVFSSTAQGVSDDGNIVTGFSNADANFLRGFTWTSGGGMVNIGVMAGGSQTLAYAATNSGDVVGYGQSGGITLTQPQAFLNLVSLGILPGGEAHSVALDLTADASTVVGYAYRGGTNEAFRWTAGSGMQSIRDLLIAAGNSMTGWQLLEATAISADGRYIVGHGINPSGHTEAWLVADVQAVPEPGSLTLVCLGAFGLVAGAMRRRAARKSAA